ncbi:MAG: hypothetical protein ACKO40_10750, partial [Planctomycetaceae bacterium]
SVDILDAANVFSAGLFDTGLPATWVQGDFSYDGIVDILDVSDFLAAGLFDAGGYNDAPASLVAVPEPAAAPLTVIAIMALAAAGRWPGQRRRRVRMN